MGAAGVQVEDRFVSGRRLQPADAGADRQGPRYGIGESLSIGPSEATGGPLGGYRGPPDSSFDVGISLNTGISESKLRPT